MHAGVVGAGCAEGDGAARKAVSADAVEAVDSDFSPVSLVVLREDAGDEGAVSAGCSGDYSDVPGGFAILLDISHKARLAGYSYCEADVEDAMPDYYAFTVHELADECNLFGLSPDGPRNLLLGRLEEMFKQTMLGG